MLPKNLIQVVFFVLTAVNGVLYLRTIVDLLHPYVGDVAYVLWIVVAPFLSPAMLGLPWFDAWVNHSPVNHELLWLWVPWIGAMCALALFGSGAPRDAKLRKPKA